MFIEVKFANKILSFVNEGEYEAHPFSWLCNTVFALV